MQKRKIAAIAGAVVWMFQPFSFADATSTETTQITGGSLIQTVKQVSFLNKQMGQMLAPTVTRTMIHGNQMARVSKDSTEIIDLDKETITRVDNVKKTYTVTTFAQMRERMSQMSKQIQQTPRTAQPTPEAPKTDLKTSFDVSVKNTGATRDIGGLSAQEQIVTLTVKIADPNAPASDGVSSVAYVVTTDAWIVPDPPELKEIHDFDIRMGKKMMAGVDMSMFTRPSGGMADPRMAGLLGSKPGAADALAEMAKEMAKVKGTRVLEVMSMGGTATGSGVSQAAGGAPSGPPPTGGSVAGQVATDTATQTAAGESSRMGVFGSALSNSALGAFRRKKATPPPAAAPAAVDSNAGAANGTVTAILMEMTTQKSFSQEAVAGSTFEVPAGYSKASSAY